MATFALHSADMTKTNTAQTDSSASQSRSRAIVTIPEVDISSLSADDPRGPFAKSVAHGRAVLAHLDDTNASNPSPCPDWTAGDLGAHLVAVLDRIEEVGKMGDVNAMPTLADGAPADFASLFAASAERVHGVWSDDELLSTIVTVPWGQIPGAVAMAVYTAEVMTHTWDLATAIGVDVEWDEEVAAAAFATVQFGLPAEGRGDEVPFGAVVATEEDAPTIVKLAAWMGRPV